MPAKIVCLVGISGSGKSTLARNLSEEYGVNNAVVVNRDKLREMLYSYSESAIFAHYSHPDFGKREVEVSKVQNRIIQGALLDGKVVIVDNTNLKMRFLNEYKKFGVPVEFVLIDTNLGMCLTRDLERTRNVGAEVIRRQWTDLNNLKKVFDFKPWYPTSFRKPEHNPNKENCVIFDIDGTLADHTGLRGPFDWSKVKEDALKKDIAALYMFCNKHKFEHNTPKIVICSGRDGSCVVETTDWLDYYGLTYDHLYMRKPDDNRPDWEIKQEFWEHISSKYNVLFMVDDRDQVVHHARRLGFTVLQVDYGDF